MSFEGPLAVRLGYDRALLAKFAERLARAVMQDMRWSAKERHGLATVNGNFLSINEITVIKLQNLLTPSHPHSPPPPSFFPQSVSIANRNRFSK